jgi:membrane-bound serine protease (ClpP class)
MGLFETIETVSIVLFVVGMVFLLIELFAPGFGIFGGLGLVALVLCIVFQAKSVAEGLLLFLIIGVIVMLLALIAARSLKRGWLYRSSLVLKDAEDKEAGYVARDDYSRFAGKNGVSLTPLRPAGTAEIEGEKADVVTEGEFIPKGAPIQVLKTVGGRIVVKQVEG